MLIHATTMQDLDRFIKRPSHGLLLTGPPGVGKGWVVKDLAARILNVQVDKLTGMAYYRSIDNEVGSQISIDNVRELFHFLQTKVPSAAGIARVIVIEDAHRLTVQAQNALLKTLEEPPEDTVLMLTATSELSLLPTITSRLQSVSIIPPRAQEAADYFINKGYAKDQVEKAVLISGGLPGIMTALLDSDTRHPLYQAVQTARELLQLTTFNRLETSEKIAKQRELWIDVLYILSQMSRTALSLGRGDVNALRRWQTIYRATYEAQRQMEGNAQLKLVMLNFMLTI